MSGVFLYIMNQKYSSDAEWKANCTATNITKKGFTLSFGQSGGAGVGEGSVGYIAYSKASRRFHREVEVTPAPPGGQFYYRELNLGRILTVLLGAVNAVDVPLGCLGYDIGVVRKHTQQVTGNFFLSPPASDSKPIRWARASVFLQNEDW